MPILRPWTAPSRLTAHGNRSGRDWAFLVRRHGGAEVARSDAEAAYVRSAKAARLEAVLLVAHGALSIRRLAQLATLADAAEVRELLAQLNSAYDQVGCAFRIEQVATGYRLLTRPQYAFWLSKLHQREAEIKLTPPALETLTIVAYRQPITRADIEAVRGVQCSDMLKQLMDRGLVRIAGEDPSLGRPFLYETTRKFLENFGLQSLDELPFADRLRVVRTAPAEPSAENTEPPPADAA